MEIDSLALIGAGLLVLANGFFVGLEFALVRLRSTQVEDLAASGDWRGRLVQNMHTHLDAYLAACQLGITLASLGLGWIGEPALIPIVEPALKFFGVFSPKTLHLVSFGLAFSIISIFHIVVGEMAPKTLGIRKPATISLWGAAPMIAFYYTMWPFIRVLNGGSLIFLKLLGLSLEEGDENIHSGEEIKKLALASHSHGMIPQTEHQLVKAALGFGQRQVREIMVPRPDTVTLDTSQPLSQTLSTVREKGHTRYPLVDGDLDNVLGMVHAKDLLSDENESAKDLKTLCRPPLYIPEVATLDKLLRGFQRNRTHLALVVDEFGGVAGLVTLEDVLEELVGPILDEFDPVDGEPEILRWGGRVSFVRAEMNLPEAAEELGFETEPTDVDTVGGYIQHLLGRIPTTGDTVDLPPYRVQITNMEGNRIRRLRFQLNTTQPITPSSAPDSQDK